MTPPADSAGRFATTQWSLVLRAGAKGDPLAKGALEALCRRYWFPLYAFVRREGHGVHEAQDLTQGFLTRLVEKDYLAAVDRSRGKFRSFLLASLRHFLANARDHARAAKRGGGQAHLSLDMTDAEERYICEPVTAWTPEKLYHRRWALELLQAVLERLRAEWQSPEKQAFFRAVEDHVAGAAPSRSHAELAEEFGMTAGAVKTAVHRLRRRYRELLREEIAHTVADAADIDEEIRQLFAALQGM